VIIRACAQCGKEYAAYPSEIKRGRTRCSRECMGLARRRTAQETFDLSVIRFSDPAVCWGWSGGIRHGYGFINLWKDGRKTTEGAHRVSYRLHIGEVPRGLFVCHSCDNPLCSNPAHLFVGTQADNLADMVTKGRGRPGPPRKGEDCNLAKLTENDVRAIRASTMPVFAVVAHYNITPGTVWRIRTRKLWKHIP
jgi:hypothetical protein